MKLQSRFLGLQSYALLCKDMQRFTEQRDERTPDEIWVVEHPPVFTLGQRESGRTDTSVEVPGMGPVPIIASDRGGLITYHGPGQMVFYVLIDLKRSGMGIRRLVAALEQSVIDLLQSCGVAGIRNEGAPGVYVEDAKIASLGLRVRRGRTYHGLSLNVDMDMSPFNEIDPCGVVGQKMTQLRALGMDDSFETIAEKMCRGLSERLGYTVYVRVSEPVEPDTASAVAATNTSLLQSAAVENVDDVSEEDKTDAERTSLMATVTELVPADRVDDENETASDALESGDARLANRPLREPVPAQVDTPGITYFGFAVAEDDDTGVDKESADNAIEAKPVVKGQDKKMVERDPEDLAFQKPSNLHLLIRHPIDET